MSSDDVPLSPLQRSKIRRLSKYKEPEHGEAAGEIELVPYLDIIMNIVVFVITTLSVVFMSTIETTPPSTGRQGHASPEDEVAETVCPGDWGRHSLKTSTGNIAPGCDRVGAGMTVPMAGSQHDFVELTAAHANSSGRTSDSPKRNR